MPQVFIPLAIGVASSIGGSLISRAFAPKPPKVSSMAGVEAGPSASELMREEETNRAVKARLIGSEFPGLQDRLGGSVSPEYYAQMAALLSGQGDAMSTALERAMQYFGLGPSRGSGLSGLSGGLDLGGGTGFNLGSLGDVIGLRDYGGGPDGRLDMTNLAYGTSLL